MTPTTRTLLALLGLAGLTAAAHAQMYVRQVYPSPSPSVWGRPDVGSYNHNNPLYQGVYPPTALYPGGYVSSQAYTNPGSTVPTTYIIHYGRVPVVPVPVVRTYMPVAARLSQAVSNLVGNAVQHGSVGTPVG